jgi:hypothetical protein
MQEVLRILFGSQEMLLKALLQLIRDFRQVLRTQGEHLLPRWGGVSRGDSDLLRS